MLVGGTVHKIVTVLPLPRLERGHLASEASALSSELQGLADADFAIRQSKSQMRTPGFYALSPGDFGQLQSA